MCCSGLPRLTKRQLFKQQLFEQDASKLEGLCTHQTTINSGDGLGSDSSIKSTARTSSLRLSFLFILGCGMALFSVFKYGNSLKSDSLIEVTPLSLSSKVIKGVGEIVADSKNKGFAKADRRLVDFLSESAVGRSRVRELIVREFARDPILGDYFNDLLDHSLENSWNNGGYQSWGDESISQLSVGDRDLIDFVSRSSVARGKIRELLVEEFVAESSPDTDPEQLLETSIEAINISESDSEPIQVDGYPFLFVGSVGAARNGKSLNERNITHLVNWSSSAKCSLFPNIRYMCIRGIRGGDGLIRHLNEAVDFVESARLSGGRIMSHCWYGRNRSVTLLVAYLMKYGGMTPSNATKLIQQTRPQADPYWKTLMRYKHFLKTGKYNMRKTGNEMNMQK